MKPGRTHQPTPHCLLMGGNTAEPGETTRALPPEAEGEPLPWGFLVSASKAQPAQAAHTWV